MGEAMKSLNIQGSVGAFVLSSVSIVFAGNDPPDAKSLVENAIRAVGGKDNLLRIKSATMNLEGQYRIEDVVFDISARYYIQIGTGFRGEHRISSDGASF